MLGRWGALAPADTDARAVFSPKTILAMLLIAALGGSCSRRGSLSEDVATVVRSSLLAVVRVVASGGMAQGSGAGFFVRGKDGGTFVVTCHHVVWGAARIVVERDDGSADDATIVGVDPMVDLAVLRTSSRAPAPYLSFSDDEALRRGERLISIGSPNGIRNVVSLGIFAARGKVPEAKLAGESFVDYLFTDAALTSGSSGGPLLNMDGAVVGVNAAVLGGGNGLGIAIPGRLAERVSDAIERYGLYAHSFVGIQVSEDLQRKGAIRVRSVSSGGPGERGDVRVDDWLMAINGRELRGSDEFLWHEFMDGPNTVWKVDFERAGRRMEVDLLLQSLLPQGLAR